ncbi:hypothetical protein GOBAR_AA20907 [Gossypium barbadense]|uniref:Uncharacterized protein n=1 Tax=Gossypium barbadense TaxID=3634 RepID=A0A2P5X8V5_GOSBA|nr:hypothetical protein GOBAR_AA20907 [Gossypium barbadense]
MACDLIPVRFTRATCCGLTCARFTRALPRELSLRISYIPIRFSAGCAYRRTFLFYVGFIRVEAYLVRPLGSPSDSSPPARICALFRGASPLMRLSRSIRDCALVAYWLWKSPNSWRAGDNQEVTRSVGGRPARGTWPHDSFDQLRMILTECLREPANFFYHYYGNRTGSSSSNIDSNNISRELNESIDIDALISSGLRLGQHVTDSRGPAAAVTPIRSSHLANLPTVIWASSPINITKDTSPSPTREDSQVAPVAERVFAKVMEDFLSSLYHLLSEVGILGLRYVEAHDKELIDT